MTAVIAEHCVVEILKRLRIKIEKKSVACFAHRFFAAQLIKFQDESRFFLLRHWMRPLCDSPALGFCAAECSNFDTMNPSSSVTP
jgi:hypothetical protein